MSDGDPTIIRYNYRGTEVPPESAQLERIANALDALIDYRMNLDKYIQLLGVSGALACMVRGANDEPDQYDSSLVLQMSPNQMALPVQAAPQSAAVYRYYGVVAANTTIQVVSTTVTEIETNTSTPSIVCTSANDTLGGTGVNKVLIQYYDQNLTGPFFVTASLNGLTPVNLDVLLQSPLCYVENIYGIEFGSGNAAAGSVQLWSGASGGGTQIGQINAGDTQTTWGRHYIPTGITCYVTDVNFALSAAGGVAGTVSAVLNFNSGNSGDANFASEMPVTGFIGEGQGSNTAFPTPIPIQGPARIYMRAWATIVTGNIWGSFGFYDLPDDNLSATVPGNPSIPLPITLVLP